MLSPVSVLRLGLKQLNDLLRDLIFQVVLQDALAVEEIVAADTGLHYVSRAEQGPDVSGLACDASEILKKVSVIAAVAPLLVAKSAARVSVSTHDAFIS